MADKKVVITVDSKSESDNTSATASAEDIPGGSTDTTEVKRDKTALNINAKREKSPIKTLRDKSPTIQPREKSPTGKLGTKQASSGTGSLALKAATQNSRLAMLRVLHDRVVKGKASEFTLSELADMRNQSNDLWAKFSVVHEQIIDSCTEEFLSSAYVTENTYTRACSFHCELNSRLARYRDELDPPKQKQAGPDTSEGASGSGGRDYLPKIVLPTFSGDYSQWISFRDLFTSLVINNRGINDVDRMHYLRASTTGEAAKLIASLAIEADSFPSAWGTITERYQNDRVLVTSHLENLFKTSVIAPRSAQELHALLHTITEACNALRVLGAPVEHWDWVLVFAIARRLDQSTREAWELKAGQSRDPPTFTQLRAFLTNRARALEGAGVGVIAGNRPSGTKPSGTDTKTTQKESRVHAATTGEYQQQCTFCRENHFIVTCPKFRQLSAEARRAEVQKLRLCFNCLGKHNVSACNTQARCKECDRKHHTMIHVGWSKFGDGSKPSNTPSSAGNTSTGSSTGNAASAGATQ